MADTRVQHGSLSLADTVASVTLTGVVSSPGANEYIIPSDITKAWIIIKSVGGWTDGGQGEFGGGMDRNTVNITNPENLLTSITFTRSASINALNFTWEIIEYTGSAGGVNEFKVLGVESLATAAATATVNSSAWTPAVDADVVCFSTSQSSDTAIRTKIAEAAYTLEWNSTKNYVTATRDVSVRAATVSVAAVEFTGSNWTIQRSAAFYNRC